MSTPSDLAALDRQRRVAELRASKGAVTWPHLSAVLDDYDQQIVELRTELAELRLQLQRSTRT